ncbi:hypothetical protein J132_07720 [Termitomyces sp. J132]|nr:hypothetical protein C0989_010486 [Termitomyces sp. Mn162]KAH0590090.1 hypothetical protein H2248_000265 [Termitomyces sp. 'cryptogamus']KNZ82136.1 hypothetical protein J132_07720 [Termitomyces sp. J132]
MHLSSSLAVLFLLFVSDIAPVAAKAHALNRLPRHHDLSERIPAANSTRLRRRRTCKHKKHPAHVPTTAAPTPTAGAAFKPAEWPAQTQAGAAPAATRASAADPFLTELSKSFNNKNNAYYTKVHTGDMTFYSTGTVSCGDTYDDSTFTAAVSKLMFDHWPGATAETNRNPICGPYVPGRKSLNTAGEFVTSVHASSFVNLGGDGLLSCAPDSQCHVPMTATVKRGDKQIVVKIVDRCEACKEGDIDLTMTAFAALADPALGRTGVTWWFNQY